MEPEVPAVDAANGERAYAKGGVGGQYEDLSFLASAPRTREVGADFDESRLDVGLRHFSPLPLLLIPRKARITATIAAGARYRI